MKIYKYSEIPLSEILKREQEEISDKIEKDVINIIRDVRLSGDDALLDFTEKFDGVKLSAIGENSIPALKVTEDEIEKAYLDQSEIFIQSFEKAASNIHRFHLRQKRQGFIADEAGGIILGQKITPIERVGIYVPGGTASYPSSVLMNAIPAKIAGVKEIIMVTPPSKDGSIEPSILAAAKIAGVTSIYKVGGAQAVAALAYGTETIPKVDKIVGPGNAYVAAAKRRVFGLVDIDMIAGPSEILVIADKTANPKHIAADMLSQAEHDKLASAVLVCDSEELAASVKSEIEKQVKLLPRRDIAKVSIEDNCKIIITANLSEAVYISNEIAPEHLEIFTDNPFEFLNDIKNAGSIFLGKNTPEAVGDYFAGPNHTLPTSGTARFSSPLSVDDFIKKSSFAFYTEEALSKAKDDIVFMARTEGLHAHAQSVSSRFDEDVPEVAEIKKKN